MPSPKYSLLIAAASFCLVFVMFFTEKKSENAVKIEAISKVIKKKKKIAKKKKIFFQ